MAERSKALVKGTRSLTKDGRDVSTKGMGFEHTRAEHNGLAVHHLNRSVTSSEYVRAVLHHLSVGLDRDLNPGPLAP